MQKFVVTGGAGFIGSHLVESLIRDGKSVTVVDDLSSGVFTNLTVGGGDPGFIKACVTNADAVAEAAAHATGIFHLAARPSVVRSVEAPIESHHHNATGTITVLDVARRARVPVVYAGSSSAYGDRPERKKTEALREDPISPYAATKLAGEGYCRSFAQVYDLPVCVTRFFNVFGPRQVAGNPYSGVVAAFCHALLHGATPRIDGDGGQTRDFVFVRDVCQGMRRAMDRLVSGEIQGCTVANLATGTPTTIRDLLATLSQQSGVEVEPEFAPPRDGDVRDSLADISVARDVLGYEPEFSLARGLRETWDWYRAAHELEHAGRR